MPGSVRIWTTPFDRPPGYSITESLAAPSPIGKHPDLLVE
jgi:hypothetical protein